MVKSVRRFYDCPIVQMSDSKTPEIEGVDEVRRIPFKLPLMLYRLKHLYSFPHEEMLILDTDVIAKRRMPDIWGIDFDIGLTRREQGKLYEGDGADIGEDMPYNTGVMFSRSQQFWEDCFNWLVPRKELHQWYGDQRAVAEVVKRGNYTFAEFKCSDFNWAPSHAGDTSDAFFWHYKGAVRKKWISTSVSTPERQPLITFSANR